MNQFLGLVYAYQALETLNSTFYRFYDYWSIQHPWVFYSTEITFFLWGPTIYFFFKLSIYPKSKLTKKDLLHFIPAILHCLFLYFQFHIYSNEEKTILLNAGVMSLTEDFVIHFFKNVLVIIYLILSAQLIRKSKTSEPEKKSWLLFFLLAFFIVEGIQILHFIDLLTRSYNTVIYNITASLWCFIAIATLYKVLQNPFILLNKETAANTPKNGANEKKEIMSGEELNLIIASIKENFLATSRYLNPEVNLQSIARELGFTSKKISYAINEHYKLNFSDFLNLQRVEEAKLKLANPEETYKTVIEIAYEVGFNSKATFNRSFSKFANVSPTVFRKNTNSSEE